MAKTTKSLKLNFFTTNVLHKTHLYLNTLLNNKYYDQLKLIEFWHTTYSAFLLWRDICIKEKKEKNLSLDAIKVTL